MSEISNQTDDSIYHQQVIRQQQMIISVLKQEILRLQQLIVLSQKQKDQYVSKYQKALEDIQNLKQKIEAIRQNNQSLIQTFQRDYNNIFTQLKQKQKKQDGPLFMELIRNMKTKFNIAVNQPIKIPQKSYISDYYGFFFHSDVQEPELQLYRQLISSKKVRVSKIKSFGKKNFFNQKFRHIFWYNSIQNTQKITFQLYQVLSDTYQSDRQNKLPQNSIIDLDLKRMDLKIEQQKSLSMKIQMKKCLQLFRLYRPDIGYIQGMSYFTWMLLIRMQNYQAFVCFTNIILHDPFIYSLYSFKKERIDKIIKFYQECLEDKKPKLAKHMTRLQVQPQIFLIEWAYTFFSRAFNLRIVSKIWDLWFSQGYNTFFKVTMVIMDMLQPELLQQKQNDRIIQILRTQTLRLDESQFIKHLHRQKLFEDLTFSNDFKK